MDNKKEIIGVKRNCQIGSAFMAINVHANQYGFSNYTLVGNHIEGEITFSSDISGYTVKLSTKSKYFEEDLIEILDVVENDAKKDN